jgi:hypothetical protein
MPPPAGGLTPRGPDNPAFRPSARQRRLYGIGGYSPFFLGYPDSTAAVTQAPASPLAPATGWLRVAVTPTNAQVFVDAYYVGTVDDVNAKRELQLEAGPHQIKFIAPQYQTLAIDVQIMPNDTLTYRGALEPAQPAAPPTPRAAGAPAPMYLIPNCYLGNVPPRASRLPASCDVKRVQILRPK